MSKYWLMVIIWALFEIGWLMALKYASSCLEWTATIIAIFISFGGLIYAGSKTTVGTCYAIFVG